MGRRGASSNKYFRLTCIELRTNWIQYKKSLQGLNMWNGKCNPGKEPPMGMIQNNLNIRNGPSNDTSSMRSISSEDISVSDLPTSCCMSNATNPAQKSGRRLQLLQVWYKFFFYFVCRSLFLFSNGFGRAKIWIFLFRQYLQQMIDLNHMGKIAIFISTSNTLIHFICICTSWHFCVLPISMPIESTMKINNRIMTIEYMYCTAHSCWMIQSESHSNAKLNTEFKQCFVLQLLINRLDQDWTVVRSFIFVTFSHINSIHFNNWLFQFQFYISFYPIRVQSVHHQNWIYFYERNLFIPFFCTYIGDGQSKTNIFHDFAEVMIRVFGKRTLILRITNGFHLTDRIS